MAQQAQQAQLDQQVITVQLGRPERLAQRVKPDQRVSKAQQATLAQQAPRARMVQLV